MVTKNSPASSGRAKIDWVREHMPVLNYLEHEFARQKPLAGRRISVCLHLEAKTGYLLEVLKAGGAEVMAVASNPLSTQDDVVAALREEGIRCPSRRGLTEEEYFCHLEEAARFEPHIVIDDGADLIVTLHQKFAHLLPNIMGGSEETTTGLTRLRAMVEEGVLAFPVIAVNDARMKHLFDNRYGTGQSVWDGIMRTTNLVVAGKNVVVVGYGWCGKGIALRAQGLGARVIVTEVDPIRANEALMDGFRVMPLLEACPIADFIITATGNYGVLRAEHFQVLKDKAVLANAGHFNVEISLSDLKSLSTYEQEVKPNLKEYIFPGGRSAYLLSEGRLVNLVAGNGHPVEIMDLSFGLQALATRYLVECAGELEPKIHRLPAELDRKVAEIRLQALGIKIDQLSAEQTSYLKSWHA